MKTRVKSGPTRGRHRGLRNPVPMHVVLLIKVSKLCNLRCVYCNETLELASKAKISLQDIERMFIHVKNYLSKWGKITGHRLDLLWHGGEPFAQPISYWEEIIELEKKVFGLRFMKNSICNDIQSNLTLLTKKHLPLLRRYFSLGFSYDVINDMRMNAGGQPTAKIVREKIEWLLSESIPIGGIAVVSKANINYPHVVADYFIEKGLSFRVLNINEGEAIPQVRDAAVPYDDYLDFLEELYRSPKVREAQEKGIQVNPLYQSRSLLESWKRNEPVTASEEECAVREWVLAVNTNGDVYPVGDCYNPEFKYGNLFTQTMEEVLASDAREKRNERSRERFKKICHGCFLFRKGCGGLFVSHATPEEIKEYERKKECHHRWLAKKMRDDL